MGPSWKGKKYLYFLAYGKKIFASDCIRLSGLNEESYKAYEKKSNELNV